MCIGALPLAMKAFGGNVGQTALTAISPAAGIISALSNKKKKPTVVVPLTTQGTPGPSPSGGY